MPDQVAVNPATGVELARHPVHDPATVRGRAKQARDRFLTWRRTPFDERASLLRRVAALLRERSELLAHVMADEMGKPVTQGTAEVEKCAWVCEHYAAHGERYLADRAESTAHSEAFVTYQPLGVVLAVMPWNFPLWQVLRAAAPTVMAGNTVLLKHASNVPGCALAIEALFRDAGAPEGLVTTLLIDGTAARKLIRSDHVAAVTLTGSTEAGRAVAREAGRALKPVVLELGGSDPYVVLRDADLDLAAEQCARSRLINSGQSCIAAKRFIVVDKVHDEFLKKFNEQMKTFGADDPMKDDTRLGPMARVDLRDELHQQVEASIKGGAKLELGGTIPDRPGAWYPATVLSNVKPGIPAHDDELFGPVASVIRAKDETDAIRIANESVFGLGAAVFTADKERGTRIAEQELEAGACFVNSLVKSDPRLPFGGVKTSGYGRELSSYGIREFVNIKTVYVA